eukprot:Pompholyxophrys_punicea_v1_NODE_39_length_4727_cov_10.240848.p2 type:complete len:198 gc:universal NODE_39_length_4727_cov_10.240848:2967-3560(+)
MTNRDLCNIIYEGKLKGKKGMELENFFINFPTIKELPADYLMKIFRNFSDRFQKSKCDIKRFEKNNTEWLQLQIPYDTDFASFLPSLKPTSTADKPSQKRKALSDLHPKSKIRRVRPLRNVAKENEFTSEEISYAFHLPTPHQMSPDEALELILSADLSQDGYQKLRNNALKFGLKNFYPPYDQILEAKKRCYPNPG